MISIHSLDMLCRKSSRSTESRRQYPKTHGPVRDGNDTPRRLSPKPCRTLRLDKRLIALESSKKGFRRNASSVWPAFQKREACSPISRRCICQSKWCFGIQEEAQRSNRETAANPEHIYGRSEAYRPELFQVPSHPARNVSRSGILGLYYQSIRRAGSADCWI